MPRAARRTTRRVVPEEPAISKRQTGLKTKSKVQKKTTKAPHPRAPPRAVKPVKPPAIKGKGNDQDADFDLPSIGEAIDSAPKRKSKPVKPAEPSTPDSTTPAKKKQKVYPQPVFPAPKFKFPLSADHGGINMGTISVEPLNPLCVPIEYLVLSEVPRYSMSRSMHF